MIVLYTLLFILLSDGDALFAQDSLADTGSVRSDTLSWSIDEESRLEFVVAPPVEAAALTFRPEDVAVGGSSVSYGVSIPGFRARGYAADFNSAALNGFRMRDIADARLLPVWFALRRWSVPVTRSGLKDPDGALGIHGQLNFDAEKQHPGLQIGYVFANSSFRHRSELGYYSGLLKSNWAFVVNASAEHAAKGYRPGTFSGSYAAHIGLSKVYDKTTCLRLNIFAVGGRQGYAAPTTREVKELAGDVYYNPNWGLDRGKIRNAVVGRIFVPRAACRIETMAFGGMLHAGLSYQGGWRSISDLDWYQALNPKPDYYQYLPSFYLTDPDGVDSVLADAARRRWSLGEEEQQINWRRLYEVNAMNRATWHGTTGRQSLYVVGADVQKMNYLQGVVAYRKQWKNRFRAAFGIRAGIQRKDYHKRMEDLLGGDFFVNRNQFAARTFVSNPAYWQYDLNHPDQLVRVGDMYQYHYQSVARRGALWGQMQVRFHRLRLFAGAGASLTFLRRVGFYKNGMFPDNSFGSSPWYRFGGYRVKAGVDWMVGRRQLVFGHAGATAQPPAFDALFFSPRTRHATVASPDRPQALAFELGYLFQSDRVQASLAIYRTDREQVSEVLHYYDDSYWSYVHYIMRDIDIRHQGAMVALRGRLGAGFSLGLRWNWMQVFYTSRPNIMIYRENDTAGKMIADRVYWKNYFVGTGPQHLLRLDGRFDFRKKWTFRTAINYGRDAYVAMNPVRLTRKALDPLLRGSSKWNQIVHQETLPVAVSLDLYMAGILSVKSPIRIAEKRRTYRCRLALSITNLLDSRSMIATARQQLRFDYVGKNPERFATKYLHAPGRQYWISVTFSL